MAEIAKIVTVIGQSPESFAKAADAAVRRRRRPCAGSMEST